MHVSARKIHLFSKVKSSKERKRKKRRDSSETMKPGGFEHETFTELSQIKNTEYRRPLEAFDVHLKSTFSRNVQPC